MDARLAADISIQSGKSLEEIATLFGDELASKPVDQIQVDDEKLPEIEHDEQRRAVAEK